MGSNQHGQLGITPQQAAAAAAAAATPAAASVEAGKATEGRQQDRHVGCFMAVLGPGSGSNVQEPVQQVTALIVNCTRCSAALAGR
jgi:hypothetical protein